MFPETLTIGRLAKAAGVGVETIRYYQHRGLLPVPTASGVYRQYPVALIERLQFIKRAQELGFALTEVADLLQLESGVNRKAIRAIATERLRQIEAKLADLGRMRRVLTGLVDACEHTGSTAACPIIATLSESGGRSEFVRTSRKPSSRGV